MFSILTFLLTFLLGCYSATDWMLEPMFTVCKLKKHIDGDTNSRVMDTDIFIQRMKKYFTQERNYSETEFNKEEMSKYLKKIHSSFKRNPFHSAVFLAHVLHNNSEFKPKNNTNETYGPRGYLQLTGKENYKKAGKEFVEDPSSLGEHSIETLEGHLTAYKNLVKPIERRSLGQSILRLNPQEVQSKNYKQDEYRDKLTSRIQIHFDICNVLNIRPFVQSESTKKYFGHYLSKSKVQKWLKKKSF